MNNTASFRHHARLLMAAASLFVLGIGAVPADAKKGDHRGHAPTRNLRTANGGGEILPLPTIIAMVQATPPYNRMEYLGGVELDPTRLVYRLKFLDGQRIVLVYVDARTGRIL